MNARHLGTARYVGIARHLGTGRQLGLPAVIAILLVTLGGAVVPSSIASAAELWETDITPQGTIEVRGEPDLVPARWVPGDVSETVLRIRNLREAEVQVGLLTNHQGDQQLLDELRVDAGEAHTDIGGRSVDLGTVPPLGTLDVPITAQLDADADADTHNRQVRLDFQLQVSDLTAPPGGTPTPEPTSTDPPSPSPSSPGASEPVDESASQSATPDPGGEGDRPRGGSLADTGAPALLAVGLLAAGSLAAAALGRKRRNRDTGAPDHTGGDDIPDDTGDDTGHQCGEGTS